MQLAYVFGNPSKKSTKKGVKGLGTPKKTSKLKLRGHAKMKKKKSKKLKGAAKAAFLARMAKGRKKHAKKAAKPAKKSKSKRKPMSKAARKAFAKRMKAARKAKGLKNPSRKQRKAKRRNPYYYEASVPHYTKKRTRSVSSGAERQFAWEAISAANKKIAELSSKLSKIDNSAGGKKHKAKAKRAIALAKKKRKALERDIKKAAVAQRGVDSTAAKWAKEGALVKKIKTNPTRKGKKMAKRRKKAKHSKKRGGKRGKRRSKRVLMSKKLSVKGRKTIRVRVNPSLNDLAKAYGPVAAAGLAQPVWEMLLKKVVSMADSMSGGMIAKISGPIDAQVGGLSTPIFSFAAIEGLKMLDSKLLKGKLGTSHGMVKDILNVLQTVNAAQVGMLVSKKYIAPSVASALSLPMAGADFGVIPQGLGFAQMGAGADFGRGADFGNVRFFPGQSDGMGEVQYIPDGQSIENHGEGGLDEDAEQMGEIPAGLGEIPQGMGEGQMG